MTILPAPNAPTPGSSTPFDALPSPLDAVDDLRAAARWLIAAAGAVGAALISGGPLVAVGKVSGLGHALIAGAALLVAVFGVGLAIWQTSRVLAPPVTTPATLRQEPMRELRKMIDAAPGDFFGLAATSVEDLLRHRAIAVGLNRAIMKEKDPRRRAILERHLRRVQVNIARTDPYVRWLLATAHVWQIQGALRRARWFSLLAAVLVAAGAVALFSVTGQQGKTYVPVLIPQITSTPSVQTT